MKISIITATHNSGVTLRDTIRSVLSQNFVDWEHIIVDGKSGDNTLDIVKEMEPAYKGRLKWISEPDQGIYDAMNKGIRMATGDIVGILNSDDFYSDDQVLSRINNEFNNNIDAVYGDIHFVNPDNLGHCVRYYSSRFFQPWMMVFGYQPAHPSFYCRKNCYERFGAFDISFRVAADFENLLRLILLHNIRIQYVPMDFVTMRTGGASTNGFLSHRRIMLDHYRAYHKNGVAAGYCFDFMRYPIKLAELVFNKLLSKTGGNSTDMPLKSRQLSDQKV